MREDHPIETLRFILRNESDSDLSKQLADTVAGLAASREWVISSPTIENDENGLKTVEHQVYSAEEPWNKYIPVEIDRKHFEEVRDLITALCKMASADFEGYLGNTYVGRIWNGQADRVLQEGLIEPWDQTTRGRTI
jgi:hypothetical protein